MLKLLHYLKKYWYIALFSAVFMVGEVLMDLIQPRLMETIVDEGILGLTSGGTPDIHLVIRLGLRMILTVLMGGTFGVLCGVCANIAGQRFGNDIRKDCFRRIMHFSFEQMDDFTPGSLITRITNDVTQVQALVMQSIRGCVRSAMMFFGGSFALLSLDLSFRTVVLTAFPVVLLEIIFIVWKTNPLFVLLQKRLDRMNGVIRENVSGARVVKAFVQEETEGERFGASNTALNETQFRVQLYLSYMRPVMNIILNLAVVAIIWIGSIDVRKGNLAPGAIMAAITYLTLILNGMMMLAMIFQTVSRGLVSGRRLLEVLETGPAIQDGTGTAPSADAAPAGPSAQGTGRGRVTFRDVSFTYPGHHHEVLSHIDLDIEPGETLAIIGATGSGKSTLVSLIPRFYDVTEGEVLVDGVNVKDYALRDLRSRVTMTLQKSELLSTTIRDNIALGLSGETDRSISDEEIEKAARAAQAHDFIMRQPDGYMTGVAEGGMSLSGGQRQRIAISRALLKHSEIIVFDDSTSALDLKTEALLHQALRREYADVTTILIAQRIASVMQADRIAVLDNGRIAGLGTHDELLQHNEVYQEICRSQMKETESSFLS